MTIDVTSGPRSSRQRGYLYYELLRTLRNRRFLFLALGFPLFFYFLIAGPNRNEQDFLNTGLSAPLYYMVGLAAFGTISAMLSSGTRIAGERESGWNRQLRITPLSPRAYLRAKVITAYMMALLTIAVLFIAGVTLGVRLPAAEWVRMTGLMLVALVPFAALGVFVGHLLTSDTIGPAVGGLTGLLAFVSGTWFPIGHGTLYQIARLLPSYWLVQASHVALGGPGWTAFGWAVVVVWAVVLGALAMAAYLRDTKRA
jgi:ABC-2 type transport system permease protein